MMDSKKSNFENTLEIIGKKYNLLIIDSVSRHQNRISFNQIVKSISSINAMTLSKRLKELEKNGLIKKGIIIATPVKTEYSLTTKGKKLLLVIKAIKDWEKETK